MADVQRTAKISTCQRYRYALTRTWDASKGEALFVMLNPSTANGHVDDPTIRKCMGFARLWGLGGVRVANLFALRATDPRDLHAAIRRGEDAVGPLNDEHVLALAHGVNRVVLAWGSNAHPYWHRAAHVSNVLEKYGLHCLGVTDNGQPRHPLMLAYETELEPIA